MYKVNSEFIYEYDCYDYYVVRNPAPSLRKNIAKAIGDQIEIDGLVKDVDEVKVKWADRGILLGERIGIKVSK